MHSIIFATNNLHKLSEINSIVPADVQIISLQQAGIHQEIPEPHFTLEENAAEKSRVIHQLTRQNCFAEDTGLEVEALQNEPGVFSARYAENDPQFTDNMDKLLFHLKDIPNRNARFRTVISLIWEGKSFLFEGICEGKILEERRGLNGFGYDPVFVPNGSEKTFAEMEMEEKNIFSHRKKATLQFIEFLKKQHGQT